MLILHKFLGFVHLLLVSLVEYFVTFLGGGVSEVLGNLVALLINLGLETAILKLYLLLGLFVKTVVFLLLYEVFVHISLVLIGSLVLDNLWLKRAIFKIFLFFDLLVFHSLQILDSIIGQVVKQLVFLLLLGFQ